MYGCCGGCAECWGVAECSTTVVVVLGAFCDPSVRASMVTKKCSHVGSSQTVAISESLSKVDAVFLV